MRVTKETHLPSYTEMGPVVSDKKIFKKFYIDIQENKPGPLAAAIFLDKSCWLEQSWWRITKETFLLNHIDICQVVSPKKIFKKFYIDT